MKTSKKSETKNLLNVRASIRNIAVSVVKQQVWIAAAVAIIIVGSFLLKVRGLIDVPSDQAVYNKIINESTTPRFNQQTLDKIKALRDSGAKNPGTDYSNNRINPFAE